jgi:hypothetical protein
VAETQGDPERGLQSLHDAEERARRDAELRDSASSVISNVRALRTDNHWRDKIAVLFADTR